MVDMPVSNASAPAQPARPQRAALPLALMLAAILALRAIHFGNPGLSYDENFYLLAGDRMLHGAVPYVDIWDRKPVLLFAIYAGIRMLGGEGFTQYLFVSALCVMATAAFLWAIARRWLDPWSAVLPALAFVVWQEPFDGGGGQTGTFTNLLAAASFWLLLRARDLGVARGTLRVGALVMVLMGLALQIKYTVVPLGIFYGCAFLWLAWRQGGQPKPLARAFAAYILIALVPTVLVVAWYWQAGHLDAFVQANVTSLFLRGSLAGGRVFVVRYIAVIGLPLAICAALGLMRLARDGGENRALAAWIALWSAAAFASFAMIGNFYLAYFQPVAMVLALACGGTLRDRRLGLIVFALLAAFPFKAGVIRTPAEDAETRTAMARLTQALAPHVDSRRCLYVYDGPVSLYMTAHACVPTRFAFPDHLSNSIEQHALGTDAGAEMARVLASRPGAIVTAWPPLPPGLNQTNAKLLRAALARDYRRTTTVDFNKRQISVWERLPAPRPDGQPLDRQDALLAS